MEKLHLALLTISISFLSFGCAPTPEELQNNNLSSGSQEESIASDNNLSETEVSDTSDSQNDVVVEINEEDEKDQEENSLVTEETGQPDLDDGNTGETEIVDDNESSDPVTEEVSLEVINEDVDNTSQLVADEDFDFRSDRDLTVSFPFFPSEVGKIVIYHAYEHHDTDTDTYYPDYSARVASYSAVPDYRYQIVSLRDWQHLVFEWLPMDGKSNEQYLLVTLSEDNEYILSF